MKYSTSFQRLLDYAAYDCALRGRTSVEVDHLMLALYREDFPLVDEVFASFTVDSLVVLDRLLKANPESAAPARRDDVQLSPEALGAIAQAEREADGFGHVVLTPSHTLIGILVHERDRLERFFIRDEIVKKRESVLREVRELVTWLRLATSAGTDRELDVIDRRTIVGIESKRIRATPDKRQSGFAVHMRMLKSFS